MSANSNNVELKVLRFIRVAHVPQAFSTELMCFQSTKLLACEGEFVYCRLVIDDDRLVVDADDNML